MIIKKTNKIELQISGILKQCADDEMLFDVIDKKGNSLGDESLTFDKILELFEGKEVKLSIVETNTTTE